MKRKSISLLAAILTFMVGVASASSSFHFRSAQTSRQEYSSANVESDYFRGSNKTHLCLKSLDVNLGDSFAHVVSQTGELQPDPNGLNENTEWQKGKLTDFYTTTGPVYEIDREHLLPSIIGCTFDDQKKLRSFYISWTLNGEQSDSIKRKIKDTLIEKELTCMKGKVIDLKRKRFAHKSDMDTYVEEFEYHFDDFPSNWSVSYSAKMK